MSKNSCRMILSNSLHQGTSRCAPSGHCMGSSTYDRCKEDWKQLCQNGINRFLLNRRNLQPCKETTAGGPYYIL
ncbi:hypothetical protein BDR07DRAFT_1392934 [Suillus spraguei]|nr:hypothetical protein BDR07DRAFT_1392934 [Suillus spraguei]